MANLALSMASKALSIQTQYCIYLCTYVRVPNVCEVEIANEGFRQAVCQQANKYSQFTLFNYIRGFVLVA